MSGGPSSSSSEAARETPGEHHALGHRIAFLARGEGERTAVLLHGLTGDRRLLDETLDGALARAGLRRLHVDLPGHGASTGDPGAASADALVEALGSLVAAEAGTRPLLVGHAYGGYLAQGLLRDLDAGGALLLCPVVEADLGRRTRPPKRVARSDEDLAFLDDHERDTFLEIAVLQTRGVLEAYRRLVLPASRATDRAFVDAVRARYAMARPCVGGLARVKAPIAVACGRDDHWVGYEDAVRLVRALPSASLHVVADAGQLLPLEQPARLAAVVDDWLARVREAG